MSLMHVAFALRMTSSLGSQRPFFGAILCEKVELDFTTLLTSFTQVTFDESLMQTSHRI